MLEGEQDVLDPGAPGDALDGEDALAVLLRRLEQGSESAQELEEQVHWERAGCVCPACRAVVVRTLSASPDPAGPH